MQTTKPLVSIIMGVLYRKEELYQLKRSVNSILNQTFSDFEFLICDGGSNEEAYQYLNAIENIDKRVRLIRDDNFPTDLAHKLNACLRYAKGEYIARMDDDDFSHPERLRIQLEYLAAHPETAFVGCNVTLQQNNVIVGERILPEFPVVKDFYFVQPYIHPTLLFRKEALLKVNGYSEEKSCILCEDYDLLLRLYAVGYQGANLQERLLEYTIPLTAKGNRKMRYRWNESVTRWHRFRDLGCLPRTLPYVIKPLIVGLLPERLLSDLKRMRTELANEDKKNT